MMKIKPCPFCGKEPHWHQDLYDGTFALYCPNEQCTMDSVATDHFVAKEEAIEAWNTRTSDWHTGTPTEEGYYLVHLKKYYYKDTVGYIVAKWERNWWRTINIGSYWNLGEEIDAWQRIEPYKEAST